MNKFTLAILLLMFAIPRIALSQFDDDFSDGDFTDSPTWEGEVGKFKVNDDKELQLFDNPDKAVTAYISTSSGVCTNASWEFLVRLGFKPSSNNYCEVYLMSNSPNLNFTTNGYYVKIGGGDKNISLYRKDVTNSALIIKGDKDVLNTNNTKVRIKVTRDNLGNWTLAYDTEGGTDFGDVKSGNDEAYNSSCFFGIKCVYTKTNSKKMFFDDFKISGEANLDDKAPEIVSVTAPYAAEVHVLFSELVEESSAIEVNNYKITDTNAHPILAQIATDNPMKVVLQFADVLEENKTYMLSVENIADLCNNVMASPATHSFSMGSVKSYDVLITEIMANPSSDLFLPNVKYVEMFNRSAFDVNLQSWNLNIRGKDYGLPNYLLKPNEYIIVCKTENIPLFKNIDESKIIGINNFPSISAKGSTLSLVDNNGVVIHAVEYKETWYKDNFKKNGGFSLEMIDVNNPCGREDNWAASKDANGGTPAQKNSIAGKNLDKDSPYPIIIDVILPDTLVVYFNESLNFESINNRDYFTVNDIGKPSWVKPEAPIFSAVKLKFDATFEKGKIYYLDFWNNIEDCSGNKILKNSSMHFAVGDSIEANDLVINEVLFNPNSGVKDFVEFYNRSQKNIDLKHLWISSKEDGKVSTSYRISEKSRIIFPGDYCAISVDIEAIIKDYYVPNPENLYQVAKMVTMPNDKGHIIINDKSMNVIDELEYDKSQHYKLLASQKGVSLERVNYNVPASVKTNWLSAAQTVGFATPGYKNSQYADEVEKSATISLSPEVFSPDNDGYNDRLIISYKLDEPGYTATVAIYDANGQFIKYIANNELLGVEGEFQWDGIDNRNLLCPIGIYIVYVEMFHLNGKKIMEKHAAVLSLKK